MKHIVVDLEMNNVRHGDKARSVCGMETIEIGAVMLDERMHEIASFRTYVKPEHNTTIVPNITRLTGISNDMVEHAPVFADAFRMFTNWCLGTGDDITIYAWSDSDYSQITKEIALKGYELTEGEAAIVNKPWTDFQKEFDLHLGFERQLSLKSALEMAGIEFAGREHDALDDARNTAELLSIFQDKEKFAKTLKAIEEVMTPSEIGSTLGSMFDFSSFLVA